MIADRKIIEISFQGASLSLLHLEAFIKNQNLDLETELLPAFDESLLGSAAGVLVDFSVAEQLLASIATMPSLVRDLQCFDCFLKDNGKWYPRLLFFETLRDLVVKKARDLDIRTCAYVVGNNIEAKIIAAVVTDLGYSTVYIIGTEHASSLQHLAHLKKKFIGVRFEYVPAEAMTASAEQGSLMVNCLDLSLLPDLQTNLSYFNFMQKNGLVVDLVLSEKPSFLMEEAGRANLRVVSAIDFYLLRDLLFLRRMGLDRLIQADDYAKSWGEFLKTLPSSSYKKRHS